MGPAHQPPREHAVKHPGPTDGHLFGSCPLLARSAGRLLHTACSRRRSRSVRRRPHPLPRRQARRQACARIPRADVGRPRTHRLGTLALRCLGWAGAAIAATGLRPRDRGLPFDPERIGLLTMTAVVVIFAVHSLVDWTWFVPANALVALLCGGWVAGRGPADARRTGNRDSPRRPPRMQVLGAAAVVLFALAASWAVFQPVRAAYAQDDALDALARGQVAASRDARRAARVDPCRRSRSGFSLWSRTRAAREQQPAGCSNAPRGGSRRAAKSGVAWVDIDSRCSTIARAQSLRSAWLTTWTRCARRRHRTFSRQRARNRPRSRRDARTASG